MADLSSHAIATRRGIDIEVRSGGAGPDLIWFHGLVGLASTEPTLEALAERFTVHAPIWPGYGTIDNEGAIEDMLDFALLGWDIVDALKVADGGGSSRPHLIGHSFGAMVAAEMACVARNDLDRLALVTPFGLWLDDHPIADPFAVLPFQLTELLFDDVEKAGLLLSAGADMASDEGLAEFMVANARRLGTAGKVMFPIPNRRLSKRLYRLTAPTLIVTAAHDRLIPEPYGEAWAAAIGGAEVAVIEGSGHMANLEQPEALAETLSGFLTG